MSQNIKQTIIAIIVIIIAFIGFKTFFVSDPNTSNSALVADKANGQFVDGQAILVLLNQLSKVTLDDSIFSDKVFNSLISFERPIADQAIGRPNPFSPIGTEGSGVSVPDNTVTKTR